MSDAVYEPKRDWQGRFESRDEDLDNAPPSAEEKAGIFSLAFFSWLSPLIKLGSKKPLQLEDLPSLRRGERASILSSRFDTVWAELSQRPQGPRLMAAYKRLFGSSMFLGGFFAGIGGFGPFAYPLLLQQILRWFKDPSRPLYEGVLLGLSLPFAALFISFCRNHEFATMFRVGVQMNAVNLTAMYKKAMRLSTESRSKTSMGAMSNMMASDSAILFNFIHFSNQVWVAPIQIILALVLLFLNIGWSGLAGVGVMIIVIPFNGFISKRVQTLSKAKLQFTDVRLKYVNDLLQGIRLIKYYSWENSFIERITEIREKELSMLGKIYRAHLLMMMSIGFVPVLTAFATFSTYSAAGNELDAETVFVTLSILELARVPLFLLPMLLAFGAMANVSLGRIRNFLCLEEADGQHMTHGSSKDKHAVVLKNASFRWEAVAKPDSADTPAAADKAEKSKEVVHPSTQGKKSKDKTADDGAGDKVSTKDKVRNKASKKKKDVASSSSSASSTLATSVSSSEAYATLSSSSAGQSSSYDESDSEDSSSDDDSDISRSGDSDDDADDNTSHIALQDLSIKVGHGELVMIMGSVGCGKSSLMSAILGDIACVEGSVQVNGSIAYVPQSPWLANASVRDNIVMGSEFKMSKYKKTLKNCALEHDLTTLDFGDQTEIGERGINLSGGQKARVGLARAVYANKDIYLLDDPLSAVDSHVGKHIFDQVITGALDGTTRIFATNQLQYLREADRIIHLDDGHIAGQGTFDELMTSSSLFKKLIDEFGGGSESDSASADSDSDSDSEDSGNDKAGVNQASANKGALTDHEDRETGAVQFTVYKRFFLAGAGCLLITLYWGLAVIGTSGRTFSQYWLATWTDGGGGKSNEFYIGVYAAIVCSAVLFIFFRDSVFITAMLRTMRNIHARLVTAIVFAPTSFFDRTPTGRVLNRFSKDLHQMDSELPNQLTNFLNMVSIIVTLMIMVSVVTAFFPIAVLPVLIALLYFQNWYRRSSRELQRLDSISRSPVIAQFTETLTGMTTIHAFDYQNMYVEENERLVDVNNQAFYIVKLASRWLDLRLALLGSVLIIAASMFVIMGRDGELGMTIEPAFAGLVLTVGVSFTNLLTWYMTFLAEIETRMTSVERILTYTDTPVETALDDTKHDPKSPNWPEQGTVEFRGVSMKYRDDYDLVLRKVSFKVKHGEKIGVVGRTGAGKSSLLVALFRMTPLHEGKIIIDGEDVTQLKLNAVRSKMDIIPQLPTLFEGSLRFNLDPFHNFDDGDLWEALRIVNLKKFVESHLQDGLESHVSEGGDNFSVGQRQLLCIARALLRKSKIVVLDEATASVDIETDDLIQKTIRKYFKNATVITIAHRLDTIIDSDRVLVMDKGRVAELAPPATLLDDGDSIFSSMIDATGASNASHLRELANDALHASKFDYSADGESSLSLSESGSLSDSDYDNSGTSSSAVSSSGAGSSSSTSASSS